MGFGHGLLLSQEWLVEVGYPARPEAAEKLGIRTLTFREWAEMPATEFRTG